MKIGYGKDSHSFDFNNTNKKLILGGIIFENYPPLSGNSDADVVLHALTNAISGVTCVNILGPIADDLCINKGIKDSSVYLKEALKYLNNMTICHISISIECASPKITPMIQIMRENISKLLSIPESSVGITATTGEDMTPFGKGLGIECVCVVTAI